MRKYQKGFTIIELMIASVIFSLVLMMCLAGVLQITKMYYKGVTIARTQEVNRSIVDEIAESIRYSGESITFQPVLAGDPLVVGPVVEATASDDTNYFCIGSKRYTYAIDRQLKRNPNPGNKEKQHVLWVDQPDSGCTGPAVLSDEKPSLNGRELLAENMRLARLEIVEDATITGLYTVRLSLAYGDDTSQGGGALGLDTVTGERTCQGENARIVGEFCAVSNTSLTVERRL